MESRLSTAGPAWHLGTAWRWEPDSALCTAPPVGESAALFTPLHYERNYRYPLLVWLHSSGDHEGQLRRIMPLISLRNYVAVAPRGTRLEVDPELARPSCTWGENASDLSLAVERVFEAIDTATSRFNVRRDRIFLAGFDSGASMALRVALSYPDRFAGCVALSGSLGKSERSLMSWKSARRLPIYLGAARHNPRYPIDRLCEDWRLLTHAGLNVTVKQYAGGNELTPAMLADLDRWMMQRITGQPVGESATAPRGFSD